jgi:hypothetical protein
MFPRHEAGPSLNLIFVFCVSVKQGLNFNLRRLVAGILATEAYPALFQKREQMQIGPETARHCNHYQI